MANSPQIYNVYGTETKHRSGHNLLAVRYYKAAMNKHAPYYSTSSHLSEFITFIPKYHKFFDCNSVGFM